MIPSLAYNGVVWMPGGTTYNLNYTSRVGGWYWLDVDDCLIGMFDTDHEAHTDMIRRQYEHLSAGRA